MSAPVDANQPLSYLADLILREMSSHPERLEYHTQVLGGIFRQPDIDRLDAAYEELARRGLIEKAGPVISYFGDAKDIYRLTDAGRRYIRESAA